jgi:4-amino-4-deoxy-L-arabinose transferase-like glycosyltransferase
MEEITTTKTGEKIEIKTPNDIEKRKKGLKNFFFGWVQDNYDKAFIGVLILAFALRIWVFIITKNQAMWFDAAEYMSTAKYWAGIGNMTDVWYYRRGFFWPLFCAVFFKLGLGETVINLVYTTLFSTGTIAVSYFLIRDMFNKKYALFASIGLTFSWVFLFFTGRSSNEIPATFFLLLSLLFFWKGYELKQGNKFIYFSAFFLAISVLTRMQNLMFIPIFFVFIFIKEKFKFFKNKSLWIALLIFILALIPLFILYNQHFGNPLTDIMSWYFGVKTGTATQTRTFLISSLFLYLVDLPYNLTMPIFILSLIGAFYFFMDLFLGFDKIFKNKIIQNKLFVFLWIFFPLLLLGYMSTYAEQRYTLMQHPFLFMIAAIPLFEIGKLIEKNFKINKKFITFLILTIFIVALIPNLLWANQLIEDKKNSYLEVKQAGEWLKENSNLDDIVVTNSFPQISYYSERRIATFGTSWRGNPESHGPEFNETEFNKFVEDEKPRFMILSIFEHHEDWMINFPQKHNDTWTPVQAYQQSGQPVLIIYEANYNS